MKRTLLVLALAVSPACGKHNDAQILQHEAEVLVKHYRPKLDAVQLRIDKIMERGKTIPGDAPGVRDLGMRLKEAHETAENLSTRLGPKDKPSPIVTDAEAAAKERNIVRLERVVAEAEETFEHGLTVIDANLDTIDAWLYHFDAKTLAMPTPIAQAEQPATPEGQATPTTGQPAGAAQPGAQPVDATQPAGATPPADSKQPAAKQPAAKQPAGTQPAAKQPAAKQPAGTQPAPAKAPAPTPAPAPPVDR